MIELDEAVPALQPLAAPTLEAFAEARGVTSSIQQATAAARSRASRPVIGLLDGIGHWAYYSAFLTERYAAAGVIRDRTTHPFMYAWNLNDRVRLHLKSDTTALDMEQLSIPGMGSIKSRGQSLVALTCAHDATGRFDPSFVHRTPDGEIWRVRVASLLERPTETAKPDTPKAGVRSRLSPARAQPSPGTAAP